MNGWREVELGSIVKFRNGKATKGIGEGSFPVYGSNGIIGTAERHMYEDAIILGRVGAYCGSVAYCRERFWATDNTIVVEPVKEVLDVLFANYLLQQANLNRYAGGSAQPLLTQTNLKGIIFKVPTLDTQRRIASILGAYDDLIKVNRRRVAVLEEMARGLFEEWFVRFRFPGHESVPLVDTPDGPLPQGWTWGHANEVIAFDPKTKIPKDGYKPFIPMGHLDTVTSLIASPESRTGNSGAKFRNEDTLFARITPCLENGKTGLVRDLPGVNGFGSTEFIVMRGERSGPAFTYCLSRLPGFRDHARSSMSGATGRQRARTESVETYAMAVPASDDLFDRFESAAWPMLELVGKLGSMNERLAASRDLLLPRLITGQLSIEACKRDLELAA